MDFLFFCDVLSVTMVGHSYWIWPKRQIMTSANLKVITFAKCSVSLSRRPSTHRGEKLLDINFNLLNSAGFFLSLSRQLQIWRPSCQSYVRTSRRPMPSISSSWPRWRCSRRRKSKEQPWTSRHPWTGSRETTSRRRMLHMRRWESIRYGFLTLFWLGEWILECLE